MSCLTYKSCQVFVLFYSSVRSKYQPLTNVWPVRTKSLYFCLQRTDCLQSIPA